MGVETDIVRDIREYCGVDRTRSRVRQWLRGLSDSQ